MSQPTPNVPDDTPNVPDDPALIRRAAEFRWSNPGASWAQVAAAVGRDRRQVYRWRQREEWEIAFREAGAGHVETLAPAAVRALIKAWSRGNPSGALDVLRSFGYLKPERLEVNHSQDRDIDAEVEELLSRLIGDRPGRAEGS